MPISAEAIAAAQAAQRKWGIPAAISLAQFGIESDFGKDEPAGSDNPFGIKELAGRPFVLARTREEHADGSSYYIEAEFARFLSLDDAFDQHASLLALGKPYAHARSLLAGGLSWQAIDAFANALTGVYATAHSYGTVLINLMRADNLYAYDDIHDLAIPAPPAAAPQTAAQAPSPILATTPAPHPAAPAPAQPQAAPVAPKPSTFPGSRQESLIFILASIFVPVVGSLVVLAVHWWRNRKAAAVSRGIPPKNLSDIHFDLETPVHSAGVLKMPLYGDGPSPVALGTGIQIPVGWGTFKVKADLFDYVDVKASAAPPPAQKEQASMTTLLAKIVSGAVTVWDDIEDDIEGKAASVKAALPASATTTLPSLVTTLKQDASDALGAVNAGLVGYEPALVTGVEALLDNALAMGTNGATVQLNPIINGGITDIAGWATKVASSWLLKQQAALAPPVTPVPATPAAAT